MNTVVEPFVCGSGLQRSCRLADTRSALESFVGAPAADWAAEGVSPYPLLRVAQEHVLIHEGAPAHHVYVVQAGDFKVVRHTVDGYEQVLDFLGRDDVLGLEGLGDGRHPHGAVALEDALVFAVPLADLDVLGQRLPDFAHRLQATLALMLARAGEVAWITSALGADRRTARFLLQLSRRMAARGQSPHRLHLRMCRRDIASHLGLAHESISRALTQFVESGLLRVNNREIEIVDAPGLERIAQCTRGGATASPSRAGVPATLRAA